MAKLTGAKKAAFLERMAKGRRKAARANNPKRKGIRPSYKSKTYYIHGGILHYSEDRGWDFDGNHFGHNLTVAQAKKKAKTLSKKNPNARRTKKAIGKGFGKQLAAEHTRSRKAAAKTRRAGSRRRNSDDMTAAERKFEEFHGRPATRIIDYETSYRYPEHFAEMGKLVELKFHLDKLNPEFSLVKFKGTQAVCTPDGQNIYFIGGDQSLDFEAMNIASDKDFVELGPCKYICYDTVKGFHDFQQTDYWHLFGEEDNIFPVLVYDRLNKSLFLVGGNYRVRPEGIVN